MSDFSLTIAIPAYNEVESLEGVVRKAYKDARKYCQNVEMLLVDDGSTDGTTLLIQKLVKNMPHLRAIFHKKNLGFTGAIKSCYKNGKKDYLFLMPADGQVDSADIGKFMKQLPNNDVVVGFRQKRPDAWIRSLNSFVFHLLYRLLFGVTLREISTAILWRQSLLNTLPITSNPRSAMAQPEIIYRAWNAHARFAQVGIPTYAREKGVAKGGNITMILVTLREMIRLWWQLRVLTSA